MDKGAIYVKKKSDLSFLEENPILSRANFIRGLEHELSSFMPPTFFNSQSWLQYREHLLTQVPYEEISYLREEYSSVISLVFFNYLIGKGDYFKI